MQGGDIHAIEGAVPPGPVPARKRPIRLLIAIFVLAVILGTAYWYLFKRNQVSTDDAYARADSAMISARVSGTLKRVLVENDQPVDPGTVLGELDPADYEAALQRAEATLAQDEAELEASKAESPQVETKTAADVQAADASLKVAVESERETRHHLDQLKETRQVASADLEQVQRDYARYTTLYKQGAGTQRQSEEATTARKKATAQLSGIDAQIAGAQASLAGIIQQKERARAQLDAAKSGRYNIEIHEQRLKALAAKRDKSRADLEIARLNLSYCVIRAPISGVIAQKGIQIGDRVQPGQALMAVVPLKEIYVEANYKETQLTKVRLGQPAVIHADVYPGVTYTGHVIGIRAGTGAAFSLLPPENATGNWIKIVQRVPVKIKLDGMPADSPLRVGYSLEVSINTTDQSGGTLVARTGPVASEPNISNSGPVPTP